MHFFETIRHLQESTRRAIAAYPVIEKIVEVSIENIFCVVLYGVQLSMVGGVSGSQLLGYSPPQAAVLGRQSASNTTPQQTAPNPGKVLLLNSSSLKLLPIL